MAKPGFVRFTITFVCREQDEDSVRTDAEIALDNIHDETPLFSRDIGSSKWIEPADYDDIWDTEDE